MPKSTRKRRNRKKEIRLDKSRFDWDTNAPPWEERKKIHPVKRPKIPDFCTSHHHNLDLIETFLFSWVTTNNNNAKKWKRKIMCVSIYFRTDSSALTISMLRMRNTTKASRISWLEDFQNFLNKNFLSDLYVQDFVSLLLHGIPSVS